MAQRIYRMSDFIMKITLLNFYWIFITIVGMGVFGLFPATVALFAVVRQWSRGNDEKFFRQFVTYVKKDFWQANILGYILVIMGFLLYADVQFILQMDGLLQEFMKYGFVFLFILYFIIAVYLFPVYVHYDLPLFKYFQFAFIIGFVKPIRTISIAACIVVIYLVSSYFPGTVIFVGISAPLAYIMWVAYGLLDQEINLEV
ncbi:Uncharacterized membrane protein YesL [Halobacillus dabanensis]|uniref:Uncharacterized membrane protein YesL n=1 Tax=Halobacillus dabanensis TaxID=240302 RepID=A0A1I3S2H6_HALDA|nr:DUF624 domain-containing protein [Halobacillus dabanensis]SFJ52865.1 Uncharacterized membrane protein YesL [Halobacillus dabanensis]